MRVDPVELQYYCNICLNDSAKVMKFICIEKFIL